MLLSNNTRVCLHTYESVFKDELGRQFHYGIRASGIQGPPTDSRTKPKSAAGRDGRFTHQSPKSVGRDRGVLGKTHVPHQIDKTLDKSLYRGDNPHLMNRFSRMI